MCWNQDVSLNTFLFSMFVLGMIMYNNKYTQYKITELNNGFVYLFFISFISIQLAEFFLWRNINDKFYNYVFSIVIIIILTIQPICSLLLLTNLALRNTMLILYSVIIIPYTIYFMSVYKNATITSHGHLKWNTNITSNSTFFSCIWVFFFLFSLFVEKYYICLSFAILLIIISFYGYYKEGAFGTMWCWLANTVFLFLAVKLLVYLPYREHKSIC